MTSGPARAQRVRLPPGEWVRQHIVQLVTLGVIVVILFACCNLPAWPTLVWYAVGHDCGTVRSVGAEGIPSDATQAVTCFAQAYHRCSAAKVTHSVDELDYSASYTFVIEPYGFTCAVGVIWNRGGLTPFNNGAGIGYCSSVRLDAGSLEVLGCQNIGDVFV